MSRRSRPWLGWLLLTATLAALWATGLVPALAADEPLTPVQRQSAATLYANQCATCHGADGRGGTIPGTEQTAPALAGNPEVTVPYVDLTVRVGRMPPPEREPFDNRARNVVVSDQARHELVLYMQEQFDLEGEVPQPPPGDAAHGREVYAANCAQCHGSTGAGGVAGAGAWTPAVTQQEDVAIAEAIRVGPFEMPRFGEEQITDQDVGDVAAFLAFVAEEQGTPLGLLELNPVYASGFAFLFAMIVLFSALWIAGRPAMFPDAGDPPDDASTPSAEEHP